MHIERTTFPFFPNDDVRITDVFVRCFAFAIDISVLWLIGECLGLLFSDYFSELGPWGILIGFGVALTYFTILESNIGGGQSVGKTFLKIKVTSCDGEYLSLSKSFIRSSIVCFIYIMALSSYANLPGAAFNQLLLTLLILSTTLHSASDYFYFFGRTMRGTLHDLTANSVVVNESVSKQIQFREAVWGKGDSVRIISIAIVCAILILYFGNVFKTTPATISLQNTLQKQFDVNFVEAKQTDGKLTFSTHTLQVEGRNETNPAKSLGIFVWAKDKRDLNTDAMAIQFEKAIRSNLPDTDVIGLAITRGYNIGIASDLHTAIYEFYSESFKQMQPATAGTTQSESE